MRNLGEYVAPDRAVLAAAIVEHQDRSRGHIIDVIADGAWRLRSRLISDGECSTREREVIAPRSDFCTLSNDAESVQCVTQRRTVERSQARHVVGRTHDANILS